MSRHARPVADRFWEKVDRRGDDECWPWLAARHTEFGYGRLFVKGVFRPAHVVSWEIAHGQPFPIGMSGCHTCDNGWCVNPRHTFPGTHADNMADAKAKGRMRNGNAEKTTCRRGHPLSGDNLVIGRLTTGRPYRSCRICRRENQRARAQSIRDSRQ